MTKDSPATCKWRGPIDNRPCPFNSNDYRVRKHENTRLCVAHWPVFDDRKTIEWLMQLLEKSRSKEQSLATFVFPQLPEGPSKSFDVGGLDLSQARFVGACSLTCNGKKATLAHAIFEQSVAIAGVYALLDLQGATFHGHLQIQGTYSGKIKLMRATCKGRVALAIGGQNPSTSFAKLDCRGATFHEVPELRPNLLPQDASFYGARFLSNTRRADSEALHRALRVAFARNSDREMEGFFYTLEKRCHRRSLNWRRSWFSRAVSCLYDWTSNYGRSYELALLWLLGVQVAFGIGYSVASGRWTFPGPVDSMTAAFTLGQLVRPFELFSARAATSDVYLAMFQDQTPSGSWLFWTATHSVVSLTLFALMLLALRWRFRRE